MNFGPDEKIPVSIKSKKITGGSIDFADYFRIAGYAEDFVLIVGLYGDDHKDIKKEYKIKIKNSVWKKLFPDKKLISSFREDYTRLRNILNFMIRAKREMGDTTPLTGDIAREMISNPSNPKFEKWFDGALKLMKLKLTDSEKNMLGEETMKKKYEALFNPGKGKIKIHPVRTAKLYRGVRDGIDYRYQGQMSKEIFNDLLNDPKNYIYNDGIFKQIKEGLLNFIFSTISSGKPK
jgi:hypothetical protein